MTKKLFILTAIFILAGSYFYFDLGELLTLYYLKSQYSILLGNYQANPVGFFSVYFLLYVLVTALSLPGAATLLTLAGGAIFGLLYATIIVSFASTVGATLAFLLSRYLFRDVLQKRFASALKSINEGIEKDGAFYLFSMRLIPAFPFFMINLLMGLTSISTIRFFIVSQIGMLAGTIVYVNAGTQLAQLDTLSDILSLNLIIAFSLLGLFPLLAKLSLNHINKLRLYKNFSRPRQFDRNLIVIGAGAGGLVTSFIAATVRSKVTLIEANKMGGDCLNTGCVPSKALIRSAKISSYINRSTEFGIDIENKKINFEKVMARVHEIIKKIEPHDSVERYTKLGVECIQGYGTIKSPFEVEINGKTLTSKNIIIATGARPFVPPIPGLREINCLTSDNLWGITQLPERLVVLGGGPIGCELAQAFARLGSRVTLIEMMPRILLREDEEVSLHIKQMFEGDNISVLAGHQAMEVKKDDETLNNTKLLVCKNITTGETLEVLFDEIICSVGRTANTTDFGLEKLGIELNPNKTIKVNDFLQTSMPNIYACGDVTGPYQFTHAAAHQAWYASINALFGKFKKFRVDYSIMPWCTYTDPEIARVGLNELEAKEQNIPYEVTRYGIDDLDRAIADGEDHGFIKVLTVPGKDKILGVTIVGHHAGELISEYVLAMKHGLGLNKILGTIHIYPTLAESNKFVAGEWKKARKPEALLKWVEKFHLLGIKK